MIMIGLMIPGGGGGGGRGQNVIAPMVIIVLIMTGLKVKRISIMTTMDVEVRTERQD
jgi:hypothetical protein